MSHDPQTHRLPAEDMLRFVLGDHPVTILNSPEDCAAAIAAADSDTLIIGTQARLANEAVARVVGALSRGLIARTRLDQFECALESNGWHIDQIVCALPNVDTARYVFNINDAVSHRFLIRELLLPRQHALPPERKTILRIYAATLGLLPRTRIFFRSYYIRAVKS